MNGTFIANQYVPGTSHRQVRTLITFDNGVEWKLMEAPEVDINQNAIDCELVMKLYINKILENFSSQNIDNSEILTTGFMYNELMLCYF